MSFLDSILYQFDHEVWEGFRFWDLVMPLFLFMTGASMPFSLSKYIGTTGSYWYLCIGESPKRVFLLFIFGMIVQWKPARSGRHASLFVFQYIAVYCCRLSYCCGHSVALPVQVAGRDNVATPSRLLGSDDVFGDFTPAGNFAEQVDRCVLGRFRDGVFWNEDGTWSFSPSYNYTWMWSSPDIRSDRHARSVCRKDNERGQGKSEKGGADVASCRTCSCWYLALLWSLQMPVIKRIWTGSMTLLSGGYCFLLMALFYYWIDYKGYTRGLNWLKVYGMNSITAYLLGEVVNFRCVAASVSYGLEQYLGGYYSVWLTFANYLIVFLLLRVMYKRGLFLKV